MENMMNQIVFWALTTAVTGLAAVGWKMGNRVLDEIDSLKADLNNKFITLKDELSKDVGSIRERLARIEAHLWPRRPYDVDNDDTNR